MTTHFDRLSRHDGSPASTSPPAALDVTPAIQTPPGPTPEPINKLTAAPSFAAAPPITAPSLAPRAAPMPGSTIAPIAANAGAANVRSFFGTNASKTFPKT